MSRGQGSPLTWRYGNPHLSASSITVAFVV
jgi:hypothetical protein